MSDFIEPTVEIRQTPAPETAFSREYQNVPPTRIMDYNVEDRTVTYERAPIPNPEPAWLADRMRAVREVISRSLAVPADLMRPSGEPHPDIDPNNPDDIGFVPVTNAKSSMEPDIGEVHEDYYEDAGYEY